MREKYSRSLKSKISCSWRSYRRWLCAPARSCRWWQDLQTTVFGIAQAVTGLQLSIFFAIGLMKVRKMGSLFIMAFLTGLFQLMMAPPMFFSNLIIGLILEILVALIFRGYKEDRAIFFAVLLYNPLSLPFNLLYNYLFGREAMVAVATRLPWLTVVMTLLVIAISALGAWIGIRISRS